MQLRNLCKFGVELWQSQIYWVPIDSAAGELCVRSDQYMVGSFRNQFEPKRGVGVVSGSAQTCE